VTTCAWAAHGSSVLFSVGDGVHHFQERWLGGSGSSWSRGSWGRSGSWSWSGVGLGNSSSNIVLRASTAVGGGVIRNVAASLLALQLALGTSAVGGFDALVLAVQFFADWRAFWIRSSAGCVALRRSANSFTLRAACLFASVLGASNRAGWAFAVNGALCARSLFASHFALGTSANWVADSRAGWIIALPLALRVALISCNSDSKQNN